MIYVITPPNKLPDTKQLLAVCRHPLVTMLQIRLKNADNNQIKQAVNLIKSICHDNGVLCILNDNPSLATELSCDGAHVGENDMPVAKAREIMGYQAIIGASCYNSLNLAKQAQRDGASYVAFGAVYPTTTKETKTSAPLTLFSDWARDLPSVAIGGISMDNVLNVKRSGANLIAMCSGIWDDYIYALKKMDKILINMENKNGN